jgi:hypothetical protein
LLDVNFREDERLPSFLRGLIHRIDDPFFKMVLLNFDVKKTKAARSILTVNVFSIRRGSIEVGESHYLVLLLIAWE